MALLARIHRNLNARGGVVEFSVTPLEGVNKGKVAFYVNAAMLVNARFRVQPTGCQRIRERGVRSVVAWVEGSIIALSDPRARLMPPPALPPVNTRHQLTERVRLDIFGGDNVFRCQMTGLPITHAKQVMLDGSGRCFVKPSRLTRDN